jgi:predicted metal-dependent hydrolase
VLFDFFATLIPVRKRRAPRRRIAAVRRPTAEQQARWKAQRRELRRAIPPLLAKWQPVIGVEARAWGIRRMKTRWGSCNVVAKRIWLNLELANRPPECLEYVVVHELIHLLERHHNARFYGFMDLHLPDWKALRKKLNSEAPSSFRSR